MLTVMFHSKDNLDFCWVYQCQLGIFSSHRVDAISTLS